MESHKVVLACHLFIGSSNSTFRQVSQDETKPSACQLAHHGSGLLQTLPLYQYQVHIDKITCLAFLTV